MTVASENTFRQAVAKAEATRQQSKAAAFITYGFVAANLAAYIVALADADVAYYTAVNTALDASNLGLTTSGFNGPIPFTWGSMVGML